MLKAVKIIVTVDFPVTLQNLRPSRRRIDAKMGPGGPAISLHATSGSISITK
jgi:hypothetical protein